MSFILTPSPHFVNQSGTKPGKYVDALHRDIIDSADNPSSPTWGSLDHSRTLDDIGILRQAYPELAEWGDLAICIAWKRYSETVHLKLWLTPDEDSRDEMFLNFCCWEQTVCEWSGGDDLETLSMANHWKNEPVNKKAEVAKQSLSIIGKILGFFFKALFKLIGIFLVTAEARKIDQSDRSDYEKNEALKSLRRNADKEGIIGYDDRAWHNRRSGPRL